jgi:hypothetical protein
MTATEVSVSEGLALSTDLFVVCGCTCDGCGIRIPANDLVRMKLYDVGEGFAAPLFLCMQCDERVGTDTALWERAVIAACARVGVRAIPIDEGAHA